MGPPVRRMLSAFQSHAGSIEAPHRLRQLQTGVEGFNPTLVRLRRTQDLKSSSACSMFQSHAGSIEALPAALPPGGLPMFQSHAGSIEALRERDRDVSLLLEFQSHAGSIEAALAVVFLAGVFGFNPTLVRLRPVILVAGGNPDVHSFNPTLVRLRRQLGVEGDVVGVLVSIPRWFD